MWRRRNRPRSAPQPRAGRFGGFGGFGARRAVVLAGVANGLLALLLCRQPSTALAWPGSPFSPTSPEARSILNLFIIVLALSALVFILVEGALFYAIFRFRDRPGAPRPTQVSGHCLLEVAWTIAPVVLLVIVFALMLPTMPVLNAQSPAGTPLRVTVFGNQWWWEYRYPELGIVTANELYVPVGQPVVLDLRSDDVIHSFWVPQLNGKLDVVPGRVNTLSFQANEPGRYGGQCTEFCGIQHAWMLSPVIALPADQFDRWVQQHQAPAAEPPDPLATVGKQVFLGKTCMNCHTIAGTPAEGQAGPDLTHLASRTTLGAGVLTNTPENLANWIQRPQDFKPGVRMPNFELRPDETAALVAYLATLQ